MRCLGLSRRGGHNLDHVEDGTPIAVGVMRGIGQRLHAVGHGVGLPLADPGGVLLQRAVPGGGDLDRVEALAGLTKHAAVEGGVEGHDVVYTGEQAHEEPDACRRRGARRACPRCG